MKKVRNACLEQIFCNARTYSTWQKKAVTQKILKEVYNLMCLGPTSANCSPLRVLFLKSKEAKERLKLHLVPESIEKTMKAPVTAIFAYDLEFYQRLLYLFPFADAKSWFEGNSALIKETAFRNSSLQGAYFVLAARACGLDCGPMSGFSNKDVDKEFFPDGQLRSNFLCNFGYGDPSRLPGSHAPRLLFDEVCKVL